MAELRGGRVHDIAPASSNLPAVRPHTSREQPRVPTGGNEMAWTTPVIVEVCVGMEITSYESAEI